MEHWKNLSLENIVEEIDGITLIEKWKPIDNFPNYLISDFGRVKSLSKLKERSNHTGNYITKDKIIKQNRQANHYLFLSLCNNSGTYTAYVHILVAKAHVLNIENKSDINHKEGIKTDNRAFMLEWVTKSENSKHAILLGLMKIRKGIENHMYGRFGSKHHNSKPIRQLSIEGNFINKFDSIWEANRETGLFAQNISKVCNGYRNSCGGFKWEYIK